MMALVLMDMIYMQVAMAYAIKFVGRYMLDRFKSMEGATPPHDPQPPCADRLHPRPCGLHPAAAMAGSDASGAIAVPPDLSEIAATSAGAPPTTHVCLPCLPYRHMPCPALPRTPCPSMPLSETPLPCPCHRHAPAV